MDTPDRANHDAKNEASRAAGPLDAALDAARDQHGRSLRQLSDDAPLLLAMTRHTGCTFCREMLAEIAEREPEIRQRGYHIAIATMSSPERNAAMASRYGLDQCSWVSDPARTLYRALELRRGRLLELFGPAVVVRGIAAMLRGHMQSGLDGDGFQMPGTFVLHRGKVVREHRHTNAADRADYDAMTCELP